MKRLKLKSTLMVLFLGIWMGVPTGVGLAQPPGSTSEMQSSELAEAKQLNQQAVQLYQQGKYDEAVPLAERSVKIRKSLLV